MLFFTALEIECAYYSFVSRCDRREAARAESGKRAKGPLLPDSIVSFDRAYIDYKWLYSLHMSKVFFVTWSKSNINYSVTGQHKMAIDKGLITDKRIMFSGFYQQDDYPEELRLVSLIDKETDEESMSLTNNFSLALQPSQKFTRQDGRSSCLSTGSNKT